MSAVKECLRILVEECNECGEGMSAGGENQ